MPLIPTYSTGIGAPDLAGAYLGRQRLQQQAAADNARISLGYAQLQQEAVANEMELAAKKELMAQQALKQAQEAEIEKSYRDTQLGMAERGLRIKEDQAAREIQEAAKAFDSGQSYRQLYQKYAPELGPDEAARRAMLEAGFGKPGYATALEGSSGRRMEESMELGKYRSDLRNIDSEMAEQRKLMAKAKTPEEKNQFLGRLSSLSRRRNALSDRPRIQAPATATATAAPIPPPQGPPAPSKMFFGTQRGVDASGFPSGEATKPPTVTTKEQYEALQSGQQYINEDGKLAFKPYKL